MAFESFSAEPTIPLPERRSKLFRDIQADQTAPFAELEKGDVMRLGGVPNELIIEEMSSVPHERRVLKAVEMGVLDTIQGKAWSFIGARPVVFANVGGERVPFYRSSQGTGGVKNASAWYPFFGLGKDGWIIKGGGNNFETAYNNPMLLKMQTILSEALNWDHQLDISEGATDNHVLRKHKETKSMFCPGSQLNILLYGKDPDLTGEKSDADAVREWIVSIFHRIYAKYTGERVKAIVRTNKERCAQIK